MGERVLKNPRAWAAFLVGTLGMGVGIGLMLAAGLGVGPLDAFNAGTSRVSGLTVGTVLIIVSSVFVIVSWLLGLKPGVGTLLSFLALGLLIDATLAVAGGSVGESSLAVRIGVWTAGMLMFGIGIVCLLASDLGASPYDQVVRSVSERFHISMGAARLACDAVLLLAAFLLGGAWGVGTVVLLIVIPIMLNAGIPRARRLVHGVES